MYLANGIRRAIGGTICSLMMAMVASCAAQSDSAEGDESLGTASEALAQCGAFSLCPPGYTPAGPACSITCGPCPAGPYPFSPANSVNCIPPIPETGTIGATPQQVAIATGALGTSDICYSTDVTNSQVWVSENGQTETLFAGLGLGGCQDATWIQIGHSYQFKLYAGSTHTTVLSKVTVTGVQAPPPGGGGGGLPGKPCPKCVVN